MTKYIQVNLSDQIDRYKLTNISVDDFIDTYLMKPDRLPISSINDIDDKEYEKSKNHHITFNVEDRFECEHYILKHPTKEDRNEWNRMVRSMNRAEWKF